MNKQNVMTKRERLTHWLGFHDWSVWVNSKARVWETDMIYFVKPKATPIQYRICKVCNFKDIRQVEL